MTEEDEEGESRAGRLRDRRRQTRNRTSKQVQEAEEETDKTDKSNERSEPAEPSQPSKTSQPTDGSEAESSSVKDEQTGTYMYLPDSLVSELAYQFKIQSAEYEREIETEFEKNRHWYPLVISLGLEQVKEMDPSAMQAALVDLRSDD